MSNTLIAITGSATPTYGHTYAEVDEMLALYNTVLETGATPEIEARMFEILDAAQPITASMRKGMKQVRADGPVEETKEVDDLLRQSGRKAERVMEFSVAPGADSPARRAGKKALKHIFKDG